MEKISEREWSKNKTPRAVAMLLHLKAYALENENGNEFCLSTFGSGCQVVANGIDNLIDDYNRTKTNLAHYEHMYRVVKNLSDEWQEAGFDYGPSEYSEERQAELRAIAKRWQEEDDRKDAGQTQDL